MFTDGVGQHRLTQPGPQSRHGGRVDDLPGLPGSSHPLQGDLRPEHDGHDVDLHAHPPAVVHVDPGVVPQEVNAGHLEELLGLVEQVDELLLLGDVAGDETNPEQEIIAG